MRNYFVNSNGELVTISNSVKVYPNGFDLGNGVFCAQNEAFNSLSFDAIRDNYIYNFQSEEWVQVTQRPSIYHSYNKNTSSWEVTQERLDIEKSKKKNEVSEHRDVLSRSPIMYSGSLFDADTQDQANISGKIQEILAREAINSQMNPQDMFWRDLNNVVFYWGSQENYKAWLQGFVIAISSRNTALYLTSWTKKLEIDNMSLIEDVMNYNVEAGWS
jgi:hypothetical protein